MDDLCRADSARGDVFAGVLSSGTASDAGESGDGDPRTLGNGIRVPHLVLCRGCQFSWVPTLGKEREGRGIRLYNDSQGVRVTRPQGYIQAANGACFSL